MSKIATNIKQSKKLIEMGIDPKSADMFYTVNTSCKNLGMLPNLFVSEGFIDIEQGEIPCWSLSALLGLAPLNIINNSTYYLVMITGGLDKYLFAYENPLKEEFEKGRWLLRASGDVCIDVVFDLICQLLEQKII